MNKLCYFSTSSQPWFWTEQSSFPLYVQHARSTNTTTPLSLFVQHLFSILFRCSINAKSTFHKSLHQHIVWKCAWTEIQLMTIQTRKSLSLSVPAWTHTCRHEHKFFPSLSNWEKYTHWHTHTNTHTFANTQPVINDAAQKVYILIQHNVTSLPQYW